MSFEKNPNSSHIPSSNIQAPFSLPLNQRWEWGFGGYDRDDTKTEELPPGLNIKHPPQLDQGELRYQSFNMSAKRQNKFDFLLNKPDINKFSQKLNEKSNKTFKQRILEKIKNKSDQNDSISFNENHIRTLPNIDTHITFSFESPSTTFSSNPIRNPLNITSSAIGSSFGNRAFDDNTMRDKKASQTINCTPEFILSAIKENNLSSVPLLNEVGSKTKKEVDCIVKEVIVNKNKL